jgi:hypothetical protein
MPTITITSKAEKLKGFRYFWLKRVHGFDPSQHCARCLKGHYIDAVSATMPTNRRIHIEADPGEVLYLCGVSAPYVWDRNFHLALIVEHGARVRTTAYTGDEIEIDGADFLEFDDHAARRLFPEKGEAFLTCRNFQFGAHHFRE